MKNDLNKSFQFQSHPNANVSKHLNLVDRVNLGSFYTPAKYVELAGSWLVKENIDRNWTIADLASGYGAFFALQEITDLKDCRYIGNDIDAQAVQKGKSIFTNVEWMQKNTLADVCREKFEIALDERLVVVGNPPYNDVTSQSNKSIKKSEIEIDSDIKTRDLGLSFLLAYNKLQAEYVAVLHPLSYLIKEGNFNLGKRFFSNYQILNHIVFPSSEFEGTSKTSVFPVVLALYKRSNGNGLTYNDILSFRFNTVEGDVFSLDSFDYVSDIVAKYPHKNRYTPEILFYTMRDINALKRSRTFIEKRIANAVDVDPKLLPYYCYIDCFKRYAEVPYFLGNFNVPYNKQNFNKIASAVTIIAKYYHPEIFQSSTAPSPTDIKMVKEYIMKCIKTTEEDKNNE